MAKDARTRAERLRRLSVIQRHFDALPIDESVATSYGHLPPRWSPPGRQPRRRVPVVGV